MQADAPDAPALEVAPAIIRRVSHWREFDAGGRQLLAESGRLSGASLRLSRATGAGLLLVKVERVVGDRAYVGQTNSGAPVETSVALAESALELGVDHPLVAGWSSTFSAARLSVDRRLSDLPAASGYVEHWRWLSWRPGLAWRGDVSQGGELVVSAALGWSSHRSLQLEQAGRDLARLEPGQGLRLEVAIGYHHRPHDSAQLRWTWQADWMWSDTKFSASSAVPLFSNGVLRGGALQPSTRTGSTDLRLGLSLQWF
jgi:hypothetical protein